jgi:hypothetical protein
VFNTIAPPEAALKALCQHLEIDFVPAMLSWNSGPAKEDGIWGKHWYDNIWKSTKFAAPDILQQPLGRELQALCDEVTPDFEYVKKYKIQI